MNPDDQQSLTIERAPSLAEAVAEKISDAISRGQFPAGMRLVETDLAARFGVSRGPVREALQLVANDGLVQVSNGRGSFVIQPSPEELERMILVRALLEGCAARLFILNKDPAALDLARDIIAQMRASTKTADVERFRDLHWKFHEAICRSADNGYLLRAWLSLRSTYRVFVRLSLVSKVAMTEVIKKHEAMLAALSGDDGNKAEAVFRSSIMEGGYEILGKEIPKGLRSYLI